MSLSGTTIGAPTRTRGRTASVGTWIRHAALTRPDRAAPLIAAGLGAIVLGQGMSLWTRFEGGTWRDFLVVALGLLAIAPLLPHALDRMLTDRTWDGLLRLVLAVGIAAGCHELLTTTTQTAIPDWYPDTPGRWLGRDDIRALILLGAGVAIAGLRSRPLLGRWHLPVLLGILAVIGTWVIAANPSPHIDVFTFQRDAAQHVMAGIDPYAVDNVNIYPPEEVARTYPPGAVSDGLVDVGYTYPPLTLAFYVPAQLLLGDVRYGNLVALLAAIALIALARPGAVARGAAGVVAFTPVGLFVLHESFTEPITLCLLAATVVAALRAPRWTGVLFGLLMVSKQHLLVLVPLTLLLIRPSMSMRDAGRQALGAAASAGLVTVPFLLWDPAALWHSLVDWFLALPMRGDSFSFLPWTVARLGTAGATLLPIPAVVAAWTLSLARIAWSPSGFALGTALVLGALFAFSKQAFPSYHVVTIGAVCLAIAAARPGAVREGQGTLASTTVAGASAISS